MALSTQKAKRQMIIRRKFRKVRRDKPGLSQEQAAGRVFGILRGERKIR